MKKVKDFCRLVWELLRGKKTYIVAVCAVVYGIYNKDSEAVLLGLGLFGLRHGVANEVAKILMEK